MNVNWLMRASRWARNPPSPRRVKLVFAVVAICAGLFALEKFVTLPDWAKTERVRMLK